MVTGRSETEKQSWHVSKEISITHLVTTGSVIVAVIYGWSKLEARIDAVEKNQVRVEQTTMLNDAKLDSRLSQIQNDIRGIKDQFLIQAQADLVRERVDRKSDSDKVRRQP